MYREHTVAYKKSRSEVQRQQSDCNAWKGYQWPWFLQSVELRARIFLHEYAMQWLMGWTVEAVSKGEPDPAVPAARAARLSGLSCGWHVLCLKGA